MEVNQTLKNLRTRLSNREWVLSSTQYATGWILLVLFLWGFVLPFFGITLAGHPLLFPTLMIAFFTHAVLGLRSTSIRYRIWKPWLDIVFLTGWIFSVSTFLLVYLPLSAGV